MPQFEHSETVTSPVDRILIQKLVERTRKAKTALQRDWASLDPTERYTLTVIAKQLYPRNLEGQEKIITALLSKDRLAPGIIQSEFDWAHRLRSFLAA